MPGQSPTAGRSSESIGHRAGEPGRRQVAATPATKRKEMPLWQEMPLLLTIAFCLAVLIRTFLVQAFFIPSASMENTLLIGDRVLVNKFIYDMRGPQRGEIVVFAGPENWLSETPPAPANQGFASKASGTLGDLVGLTRPGDKDFIKRIIGMPGDRVSCCDAQGRVQINGVPIEEPYIFENSPLEASAEGQCRGRRFDEVVVGEGQMLVMGDHRLVSLDGRCQGLVPINKIIGRAIVVAWPTTSWRDLEPPSTFDAVPAGAPPGPTRAQPARKAQIPD
ncbi:signal peptidase I [Pilimelia columellifera]